jgi:hypothetical protein
MSNTVERFTAEHQGWHFATLAIYFPQKPAQPATFYSISALPIKRFSFRRNYF